jgi:protease secretion system membrane fusion protein
MKSLLGGMRSRFATLLNPPPMDPDAVQVEDASADFAPVVRTGKWLLGLGLGGFLLWASLAPLDEGVPAPGTLVVESRRKTISHQTGGTVASVLAKDDALVNEGDPLVILDDTAVRAEFESAQQGYFASLAAAARLRAEQSAANRVSFPQPLLREPRHPLAQQHMATQQALFESRRAALASDLAVLVHAAESAELASSGLQTQKLLLEDELKGLRDLAAEGYTPRNQLLLKEREFADAATRVVQAGRAAADARLRMQQRRREYRQEVDTELSRVEPLVAEGAERVTVLRQALDRTVIRSPARGYITGLTVRSKGAVVPPGAKLLEVIPVNERLEIEARIPPHIIDNVRAGLKARVGLHAFPQDPGLVVDATVLGVSADVVYSADPQVAPYFVARIRVSPEGMKDLGNHELQAGMPADVLVLTGERTMIDYLLRPILRRMEQSFKES